MRCGGCNLPFAIMWRSLINISFFSSFFFLTFAQFLSSIFFSLQLTTLKNTLPLPERETDRQREMYINEYFLESSNISTNTSKSEQKNAYFLKTYPLFIMLRSAWFDVTLMYALLIIKQTLFARCRWKLLVQNCHEKLH